ncbi:MAG: hypothetical protein MJA83_09630, partial [Gammaproteobacteria bacterium]|nr:hypothetical protein [Gammaproteobacteria bacterium]
MFKYRLVDNLVPARYFGLAAAGIRAVSRRTKEIADHGGPATDYAHVLLKEIACRYPAPVHAREGVVEQDFLHALLEPLGDLVEHHDFKLGDHFAGLCLGGLAALLTVDRLRH